MKRKSSYTVFFVTICLVTYGMALFKPFAAYLAYRVNVELISSTLCIQKNSENNCCRGKCYLSDQLEKASKEEAQQKVPGLKIMQEEIVVQAFVFNPFGQSCRIMFAEKGYDLLAPGKRADVPPPQQISC